MREDSSAVSVGKSSIGESKVRSESPLGAGPGQTDESFFNRLLARAFERVDAASLAVVRMGFGLIVAWWAVDYLLSGRAEQIFIAPRFHFTYYLFDWLPVLPRGAFVAQFWLMAVLGVLIAAGACYRAATVLFALSFSYLFLLERTNYQNHYYLVTLLSWLFAILPLNRCWAMDAWMQEQRPSPTVSRWMLWLVRFHFGIPYFFGGIAKFDSDWFAGFPFRQTLHAQADWPIIGPWFLQEWVVQIFIWGGVLFDLSIVPLLLWRRTRVLGYLLCLFFHVMNSQLFSIHIFPWLMIVATTVFFEPDWPRRFLRAAKIAVPKNERVEWSRMSVAARGLTVLVVLYVGVHCLLPFRHLLYSGPTNWTERGHHFAWRMMLRGKLIGVRYYLTDPRNGQTFIPDLRTVLTPLQMRSFARDPEMIHHFAQFLASDYVQRAGVRPEVRAVVLTSLNGRKPQLQIDPNVDLAGEPRGFYSRTWITQLTEPLPAVPWTVPVQEWERHVEIPLLAFQERTRANEIAKGN